MIKSYVQLPALRSKSSLFIAIILAYWGTHLSQYSSDSLSEIHRGQYEAFINNHEYSKRPQPNGQEKKEGKKPKPTDRPDLAWEQNFLQTMDPALGYPPTERLQAVRNYIINQKAKNKGITPLSTANWTERGPSNVGGRTRAIMFDPNDGTEKKIWAGGVAGGLWYTNDITVASPTWNAVNDFWANLAISTIAYDPSNTSVFYVGTGEGWFNVDAVRGAGIWKTTNGGSSWTQLASTMNVNFYYVEKIVVHPTSGDVYAATRNNGVMRSQDGGTSWSKVLGASAGASTSRAADLEIGADGTIYASMGIFVTDGIYSSSTGNLSSWTKLNTGGSGFPTTGFERIELATAPSNSNIIYALAQDASTNDLLNAYKSTNKGSTWTTLTFPTDADGGVSPGFTRGQAWYDLIAAVDPNDANTIFIGGVDLFKSTDAGSNWTQISHWYGGFGYPEVHADQHAIVFQPGSSTTLVFGHDGGLSYTANGTSATPTFSNKNTGYNVTQFYSCAMNGTSGSNNFIAGAQDNGTNKFTTAGVNSTTEVYGGDGAFCFIDQDASNYQIASYVYNSYKLSSNGTNFTTTLSWDQATGSFINPADYDDRENILYSAYSTTQIQRITNVTSTPSVAAVTISGLGAMATHLRVSPYSTPGTSTIFIGTAAGKLFKVTNAHSTPTVNEITGTSFPVSSISCVEIGANEQNLLVTFSNFGVTSVWQSTNGGTSWSAKEGDLPDMPVRWALFNPNDYNEVLLATEVGIWSTTNITASSPAWVANNSGLSNVRVDMLQIRTSDKMVIAATHGRGLFSSNVFYTAPPVAAFTASSTTFCGGTSINFTDQSTNTPTSWSWFFGGGTPSTSTSQNPSITYSTPGVYNVTLTATNAGGSDAEIKTGYITVNDCNPVANFSASSTTICAGSPVTFTDLTTNTPTSWSWKFGGGTPATSTSQNPVIAYNTPGVYSVTLTSTNSSGSDAEIKSGYITVNNCVPVANFSVTSVSTCTGNSLSFTDLSTNTPTSWSWVFQGGTPSSSNAQNPSITYNTPGVYNVTLTATNGSGNDAEIKTSYITVSACTQIASPYCGITLNKLSDFIYLNPVSGATNYEYRFTPSGGGTALTRQTGQAISYFSPLGINGIKYNVTYDVDVRAYVGGAWGTYGVICQITTPATFPTTQLKPAYCSYTLPNLNSQVYCEMIEGASNYQYLITNSGTGFSKTVSRNSSFNDFSFTWVSGLQYGLTYDVQVKAYVGGVWGAYGNTCQVTTPAVLPSTQLQAGYCSYTLPNLNKEVYCEVVPGATNYQYLITNSGTGFTKTVNRNSSYNNFSFTWVSGIKYGLTYDVQVKAYVGGVWGAYGNTCQVSTPAAFPTTQLQASYCSYTLPNLNSPVYCEVVTGATNYQYLITNSGTGFSKTVTRNTSYNDFSFTWVSGVQYGLTYDVQVKACVGGVWGAYGNTCQVTIPSFPTTQLQTAYCSYTLPALNSAVYCDIVPGATNYQYFITNSGTGFSKTVNRNTGYNDFHFTWVTGIQYALTYDVQVKAYVGGVWGAYGNTCQVTTPLAPIAGDLDQTDLNHVDEASNLTTSLQDEPLEFNSTTWSVFPNPSSDGNVNITLSGNNSSSCTISVFDMGGKEMISNTYTLIEGINSLSLNLSEQNPLSGIYLVRLMTDETVKYSKLIIEK